MELEKNFVFGQHAYLIDGFGVPAVLAAIEKAFGVTVEGNPDIRHIAFESLGIEEARALKEEQGLRAFGGGRKFFIIETPSLTREAQNALLKVFEEPTEGTYLFLLLPDGRRILPTLQSRLRLVRSEPDTIDGHEAREFLSLAPPERLQMPFVKKLVEEKEKTAVISFFNALEKTAHELVSRRNMTEEEQAFFAELIKCRGYAGDRSSSVKMLLEHIALTAPVIG